jgi:pre-mRNA-splicing factor SYF1
MIQSISKSHHPPDLAPRDSTPQIFHTDPTGQAMIYAEAIMTVDPMKATGKPHILWLAFAKMYECRCLLDSAQDVFQCATQVNFKSVDDLATVWYEWRSGPRWSSGTRIMRQPSTSPGMRC